MTNSVNYGIIGKKKVTERYNVGKEKIMANTMFTRRKINGDEYIQDLHHEWKIYSSKMIACRHRLCICPLF